MKEFFARAMIWAAMVLSVSPVAASDLGEDQRFDTAGFLTDCTGHVPNGQYSIVMDGQCVSQAVKFCNLSLDLHGLQECVAEATGWLNSDAVREREKGSTLGSPEIAEMLSYERPSTSVLGMQIDRLNNFDCKNVQDRELTQEVLCAYGDALAAWHEARELRRASERRIFANE
ncbi:hypothetical protein A9Q94_17710 [Rhodobacterales bacterium 56_14_T64]|nr:hypothetical protein A9Q94_17710 [Rhodobacterales bacterium 56_14_T64]